MAQIKQPDEVSNNKLLKNSANKNIFSEKFCWINS